MSPAPQRKTLDQRWTQSQKQSLAPAAAALGRAKQRRSLLYPETLLHLNLEEKMVSDQRRREGRRTARKMNAGHRG